MSSSTRPPSPPRAESASVTNTTASTSPKSTFSPSTGSGTGAVGSGSRGAPSATASSSISASQFPAPPGHQHPAPPPPPPPPPPPTNPTQLPSAAQEAQIAQARTALVASLGNALDTELGARAGLLHAGQSAIERQERDVAAALGALRKEDDRLLRVLDEGSRRVKELGDVQNWAERLERDFLVLEETVRLVEDGSGSGSGSWSGSQSGSWSGSEDGSERGSVVADEGGDIHMADGDADADADADADVDVEGEGIAKGAAPVDKGKGKAVAPTTFPSDAMDVEPAQTPLPSDDASESAMSGPVDNTQLKATEQTVAAPPQSPGATTWLRRLIWRGS